jgi:hypothetical protein
MLIDKSRSWHALEIALHMNMHSESFYPYTHGDKDTFHMAWILAGAGWEMPDYPARWCETGIYQRDFLGRLIFQHRTDAKWRLTGDNRRFPNFHHQEQCLRFISELRDRWSGRIEALPPGSPSDRELEDTLAQIRWFSLEEPGAESRLLELLDGNRVGIGSSSKSMLRWYVRDGVLTLDGVVDTLPPFSPQAGGGWSSAPSPGEAKLALVPAPEAGLDALGATATAVLERFADDHALTEEEVVTTLSALAQVGDLTNALQRARSRWHSSDEAQRAIERAGRRAGLRNPSQDFRAIPGYQALE